MKILVLGLGNALMADDAFGGRVVEFLQNQYVFDPEVEVLDGGTLGLDLLPRFEGVSRLLLIDAVDMGAKPGRVFRLEGDEVPRAFSDKLSVHQMGLKDLLAVAELQGDLPQEVVLWGVQPGCIEMRLEMTAEVSAALPRVANGVLEDLQVWTGRCFASLNTDEIPS
ncbi:MAG: HyaD/HybD family hydrogenase maturation endopeptidase [Geoalkalibacter sp.]|uniref:HyaD/HybD family hydrogenase maturation endopeptidase n=1 Tax=Geoalkalibacter sp. TaxID=3041440 RepID=UPI003D0A8CD8